VPCGELELHIGETIAVCGFLVAYRPHRGGVQRDGEPMCFATIEDGTGIVEATLFPKVFQLFGGVLQGRGPFVVRGLVEERLGGTGLHAYEVALAAP
jgi:DNA polymerase III alpha subunit